MSEKASIAEIQAAVTAAEHALGRFGSDLQFLVTQEGHLEIARRTSTGDTIAPKEVIAELEGADLALWRAERPAAPQFSTTKMIDEIRSFSRRLSPDSLVINSDESVASPKAI